MNGVMMEVDQEVLVRLLLAQRAMLLGYIASLVRDAHLAEDVFQDVSLIVLKKHEELSDLSGFPAWSRKIARLEAMNALRRRNKAPQPLDQAVLDVLDLHWNAGKEEAAGSDALQSCLERLSPRSKKLVDNPNIWPAKRLRRSRAENMLARIRYIRHA